MRIVEIKINLLSKLNVIQIIKIEINNLDLKSDCSIKISNSNFEKLIKKELNTSMALISGDITIEGDMSVALKISDLFE